MRHVNPGKAWRLVVITAVALGLATPSAFAADIQNKLTRYLVPWSQGSSWVGGVVPGADDNVGFTEVCDFLYDGPVVAGGFGKVGSMSGKALTLTLKANLEVRDLFLLEGKIFDGGKDLKVTGELVNLAIGYPQPGGGKRTGQGGNLDIANLRLGRASDYIFFPGDIIRSTYTAVNYQGWPDITVTQNPEFYGNRLDKGLSFENEASDAISLGRTSATDQAEITLSWDTGFNGPIDWTLRWKGDHVAALQEYHAKGQIKIGTLPTGMTFKPNENIFFDLATGYTYVGFKVVVAADTWVKKLDIPGNPPGNGRYGAVGFSIGGKGYVGTGNDGVDKKDFWEYDPATNAWSPKASFSGSPRQYAVGFAIAGKGYIGTGLGATDFWEYDPGSDTWTRKADFPGSPRGGAVAFVIGKKGYVGTGGAPGRTFSDLWEYDPAQDKPGGQPWVRKADLGTGMPGVQAVPRSSAIGFSVGAYGYVGTGTDGSLRNYVGDFWKYDPVSNTWQPIAPFKGGGLIYGTGFGTATKGYAFEPNSGNFFEYDPVANAWNLKKKPEGAKPMNSAVSFSIGNKGYYGTGYDYTNRADIWEYTP